MGVAQHGTFSAAALEMNISQPALGLQVKKLEDHLKTELLERHSRGVKLTPAGEVFFNRAQKILAEVEAAEAAIAELKGVVSGEITIASTPTAARALAPDLIDECSVAHRDIRLNFVQRLSREVLDMEKTGSVDIGLAYDVVPEEGVFAEPLFSESLYVVGSAEAVGKTSENIQFKELEKLPLVLERKSHNARQILERMAERRDMNLSNVLEMDGVSIRREMVARGNKSTVTPYGLFLEEIMTGAFLARKIVTPEVGRTLYFVCQESRLESPIIKVMLETIKKQIKQRIEDGHYRWRSVNSGFS